MTPEELQKLKDMIDAYEKQTVMELEFDDGVSEPVKCKVRVKNIHVDWQVDLEIVGNPNLN